MHSISISMSRAQFNAQYSPEKLHTKRAADERNHVVAEKIMNIFSSAWCTYEPFRRFSDQRIKHRRPSSRRQEHVLTEQVLRIAAFFRRSLIGTLRHFPKVKVSQRSRVAYGSKPVSTTVNPCKIDAIFAFEGHPEITPNAPVGKANSSVCRNFTESFSARRTIL